MSFTLNNTNVATIRPETEHELRQAIDILKLHWEIKSDISILRKRADELVTLSEELVKEIRQHIVTKIENENYETECDECQSWKTILTHSQLSSSIYFPQQSSIPHISAGVLPSNAMCGLM